MTTAKKTTKALIAAAFAATCLITSAQLSLAQGRKARGAQVATRGGFTVNRSTRSGNEVVNYHLGRYQEYIPMLTRGDREFGGHGPKVQVFVKFFIQRNTICRRISLVAQETSGGTSHAEGWSTNHYVYRPPAGKTIESFSIPGHTNSRAVVDETMHGHNPIRRDTPLGRVTVYGDRDGGDIEKYTRVRVDFDCELTVVLSGRSLHNDEANLPGTFKLMPVHRSGDRDFKGHGPHVQINAGVGHDGRQAFFIVTMDAKETTGDGTRAMSTGKVRFYRAPLQYHIVAIRGKRNWTNLINYTDTDHSPDRFTTDLGPVIVYGDRRGDDAGVYTRVEFPYIQRRVIIELERDSQ